MAVALRASQRSSFFRGHGRSRYPSRIAMFRCQSTHRVGRQSARKSKELSNYTLPKYSTLLPQLGGYCAFNPSIREPSYCQQNCTPVLACSTATNPRLISRIAKRVREWLKRAWEALLIALRTTEIALRMSPLVILTPAAMLSSKMSNSCFISDLAWWYTLQQLQGLGPCFVKLAQWIATRRDLFPPHVCDRFSKLHDGGSTHSWKYTDSVLREAFGDNYQTCQLQVDPNDIVGCGSAAQVYKGQVVSIENDKTTRRNVAVKVLHPRFQDMVECDLQLMQAIANLLHHVPLLREYVVWLNLPQVAQNFGQLLRLQSDLRVEGSNLQTFCNNFSEKDSCIVFPKPIWVSQHVLVQEFVQYAKPISDYIQDDSPEGWVIRKELAGPLLRAFYKMVFMDNFVHCDLHPGNVFVQEEQETITPSTSSFWSLTKSDTIQTTRRKIVFVDAGIAMSLTPNDSKNLRDLFYAIIVKRDGNQAGRLMVERAKYERCSETPGCVDSFARGIDGIVQEFHDRTKRNLTLGAVRIGSLLNRVLDQCRVHGVEVDPSMANIVISTLVLEGLGRSLEPELNLMDLAVPFILGRGKV